MEGEHLPCIPLNVEAVTEPSRQTQGPKAMGKVNMGHVQALRPPSNGLEGIQDTRIRVVAPTQVRQKINRCGRLHLHEEGQDQGGGGGDSQKSDIMLKTPPEPNLKKWGVLGGGF